MSNMLYDFKSTVYNIPNIILFKGSILCYVNFYLAHVYLGSLASQFSYSSSVNDSHGELIFQKG